MTPRVLNKYCWCVLYSGKLTRYKIITIHIHVKSRNQTNNRHSRGFDNWTVENDWILLGVGCEGRRDGEETKKLAP